MFDAGKILTFKGTVVACRKILGAVKRVDPTASVAFEMGEANACGTLCAYRLTELAHAAWVSAIREASS